MKKTIKNIFLLLSVFFSFQGMASAQLNISGDYYKVTSLNSTNINGKILSENFENVTYNGFVSSNSGITVSTTINNDGSFESTINNLGKNNFIGLKFIDNNGIEDIFFTNVISTLDFSSIGTLTGSKVGNDYSIQINGEIEIINRDIEILTQLNETLLIDSNGTHIFSLDKVGSDYFLIKKSKTFLNINKYEVNFLSSSDSDITSSINDNLFEKMYVIENNIYIVYDNKLFKINTNANGSILVTNGEVDIKDTGEVQSGESLKNINGEITNTSINNPSNGKFLQLGDTIYSLSNNIFSIDFYKGSYQSTENIYNVNISSQNITDFYIIDNNIFLYSRVNNNLYYMNGNIIYYYLYENANFLDKTTQNNFLVDVKNKLSQYDLTLSGTLGTLTNGINTNGGINSNQHFINDDVVGVSINPGSVNTQTLNGSFNIKKESLDNGISDIGNISVNYNIPVVGYGVLFQGINSSESCNRTKAIPLNTTYSNINKVFKAGNGYYCLYISPYDEGLNTTIEPYVVQFNNQNIPIFVQNEFVTFGDPEIERDVLQDDQETLNFYITSSSLLKTITIRYLDREGDTIIKTLDATGTGKIQLVSSDGNIHKYVFSNDVQELSQTTTFNIDGEDYYGNVGNLIYQYDLYRGTFQVLGLTKTNSSQGLSSINKYQAESGFLYGIISPNLENTQNVNSLFFFDKNTNSLNENINIPLASNDEINLDMLKFNIPEFRGRIKKDFVYDNTKMDYIFENGYYYYHKGDLTIDEKFNYYGNGIILVEGKVIIKENIAKSISSQTTAYNNSLKIYSTKDIEIFTNVNKIDSDLLTNAKVLTYGTINSNALNTGLGGTIDTGGFFIFGLSKIGDPF